MNPNTARMSAAACVALCLAISSAPADGVWTNSYSRGLRLGQEQKKHILVDFYSDGCPPCVRMDRDVYGDKKVLAALKDFVCVKIDIERDRRTAATFRIGSIPRAIVINPDGRIAGDSVGYLSPEAFMSFLADAVKPVSQPLDLIEAPGIAPAEDIAAMHAAVATQALASTFSPEFLQYLGNADPEVRAEVRGSVKNTGRVLLPQLVTALGNDYLGVRIAAWQLLGDITNRRAAFDPWASASEREKMRHEVILEVLGKEPEKR